MGRKSIYPLTVVKECVGCGKELKRIVHNLMHRKRKEFCTKYCERAFRKEQIRLGKVRETNRIGVPTEKEKEIMDEPVINYESLKERDEQYKLALRRHYGLKEI